LNAEHALRSSGADHSRTLDQDYKWHVGAGMYLEYNLVIFLRQQKNRLLKKQGREWSKRVFIYTQPVHMTGEPDCGFTNTVLRVVA
jgi:hypothetical protein